MAYCKHCDKDVEPVRIGNRFRCPDCNLYVKVSDEEKEEPQVTEIPQSQEEEQSGKPEKGKRKEPEVVQEGGTKLIITPKTVKYDAADLHMGEILIDHGFAKDLNDLSRKNMKLAFSLMNMGAVGKQFNTMETNQEPDPKRTMAQIQEQKLMESYIKSLDSGSHTDPMMTMMMMRMLENQGKGKESGDNGFMKEMMQIQMMKTMAGGNDQQASALQRELADLKHQQSLYQVVAQQQQTQQGNQMSQEFMAKMENIKAERDKEVKRIEIEAQGQRDKNMQLVFNTKLQEIQNDMEKVVTEAKKKGEKADLTSFAEQFKTVKELSKMVGDKEKGAGEYIAETVGELGKNVGPALMEFAKQKREQQAMQPQQMPQPPEELQEVPQPPQQEMTLPSNPELTPSEQEMANTMEDIYIKERK